MRRTPLLPSVGVEVEYGQVLLGNLCIRRTAAVKTAGSDTKTSVECFDGDSDLLCCRREKQFLHQ